MSKGHTLGWGRLHCKRSAIHLGFNLSCQIFSLVYVKEPLHFLPLATVTVDCELITVFFSYLRDSSLAVLKMPKDQHALSWESLLTNALKSLGM